MLEVLEIAFGLIDAVRAWRLWVFVIGGFFGGTFAMDFVSPGVARVVVLAAVLLPCVIVGAVWQYRHQHRNAQA